MTMGVTILSPHLDDAVLSCCQLLLGSGHVHIINVFAGVPETGSTGWWDRVGEASDSAARMRERLEEDRIALRLAGGRHATNLPFLDDQYRRSPCAARSLIELLRSHVPTDTRLYAPAAIGTHPDHAAVREAAMSMRNHGIRLSLYADLPHASARGWPAWVMGDADAGTGVTRAWNADLARTGISLDHFRPTVHTLSRTEHRRKLAAIHAYATQRKPLETWFGRCLADSSLLNYEVEWELKQDW
jgi:LmbE family N-acetylglucosaminyl deacetylase